MPPNWLRHESTAMTIRTILYRLLFSLSLLLVGVLATVWFITFHPDPVQQEPVYCSAQPPTLPPGKTLKVYNQNVQFMAGKNYVFFYDLANNSGPDERPSATDITNTLHAIAKQIKQQNPDVILLQEVDDGAKRTGYADQLAQLLALLPSDYACHASSMYWQASYVPHPRIMGAVGTKLSVISKYKITAATRIQLSLIPQDPINQLFNFKRALLDVRLAVNGGDELAVLNTHLSAFSKGTYALQKQINQIDRHLKTLNGSKTPWIIGGDFNLLPPNAYASLAKEQRTNYETASAITTLYKNHSAIPSLLETQSKQPQQWFSYFPNDPRVTKPDRTIDYYFYSPQLTRVNAFVEQNKSLTVSDHMPIIASFMLP
jgi:endonuclease/exonuclease/phosphatase family metal-dependent hydrolase